MFKRLALPFMTSTLDVDLPDFTLTSRRRTTQRRVALFALLAAAALLGANSARADEPEIALVIKNHKFEPAEIKVAAGVKVKLVIHNQDSSAEEFESAILRREKLVPAGQKVVVYIGPLKAGSYPFIGEFNQATAQGRVVVE
jgi:plastocyanin